MNIPVVSMKTSKWHHFINNMFTKVYLYDYEKLCFDAWYLRLSPETRHIVDRQLLNLEKISHMADGLKNCFFYKRDGADKLFCLAGQTKPGWQPSGYATLARKIASMQ